MENYKSLYLQSEKEKKKQGIDDYLQSPRKKRKNYVVMAYSRFLTPELASSIQSYLKTTFPNLTLAYPRSEQELVRNFTKQIKLLIFIHPFFKVGRNYLYFWIGPHVDFRQRCELRPFFDRYNGMLPFGHIQCKLARAAADFQN